MIQKSYKKKTANEICKRLDDGLGFSCRIVLIKRTILSPRGKKYKIKTDAPENIVHDIIVKT